MTESADEVRAPNLYYDSTFQTEAVKLLPGEYFATGRDIVLVTVLGSCVAACVRDIESGVGGMNHFMLPDAGSDPDNPLTESARYGSYAMEVLLNQLAKRGARRRNLEAKVFGGGNVMPGLTVSNVGARNARFVLDYLSREGIRVAASDLEGPRARKVYFFPASGRVLVRKFESLHNDTIVQREIEYRTRLKTERVSGEVEIFA